MKKALHWMISGLLYSNLFIAVCAMAFLSEAYLLLGKEMKFDLLFCFAGLSTFFTYMFIRITAVKRIAEYEPDDRWHFFLRHIRLFRVITAIAFSGCGIIYFMLDRDLQIALLVPGIISIIYGLPLGAKFRLRDVGVIKIFLISFVWSYVSSVLPAIHSDMKAISPAVLILFLANYLFIFAITLPFDIKDLKIDALNQVKTIPVHLGEENTYGLSMLLLFLSATLHVYLQRTLLSNSIDYSHPLTISILITGLLIWFTKGREKYNFLYFGLLDGMILLQFLLCYIYNRSY